MNILEAVKGNASVEFKRGLVKSASESELFSIQAKDLIGIIKACDYTDSRRLRFANRVTNHWNSEIEGIYLSSKGELFFDVYVQDDSTDTNMCVTYYDMMRVAHLYCERLDMNVRYSREEIANAFREILNTYITIVFEIGVDKLRNKKEVKERLQRLSSEVLNKKYADLRLKYVSISRYSSNDSICRNKGYYAGQKVIHELIDDNWDKLAGKTDDEIKTMMLQAFNQGYDDFQKDFDVYEYRKGLLW